MRRFWSLLPLPFLLLGGCRIEQTPTRFIDQIETPEAETRASEEELTDRLLSTAPSLQRGDVGDAMTALAPHPELAAFGATTDSLLRNPTAVREELAELAGHASLAVEEVDVSVAPGNDIAWFRATYAVRDTMPEPERVHFTGVFLREEGEWRLVQGHFSRPPIPEPVPPEQPDTLEAAE